MAKVKEQVGNPSVIPDLLRHTLSNIAIIAVFVLAMSLSAAVTSVPLRPPTCHLSLTAFVTASVRWSAAQILRSIVPAEVEKAWRAADVWEADAWRLWEEDPAASTTETKLLTMDVPVLDLTSCHQFEGGSTSSKSPCRPTASDVANLFGFDFRSRPLYIRGLVNRTSLASPSRRLSLNGMANHPSLANLTVPYYADASKSGYEALKPSGVAPLHEIVHNITNLGGRQKIGSQVLVETYPQLIEEVAPREVVTELFGNYFEPDDVRGSGLFRMLPARTTVPVFLAGSRGGAAKGVECTAAGDGTSSTDATARDGDRPTHPRTDLHCEPIGNVAVQLHNSKVWTLVPPSQSSYLRPSLSPVRAFFYSNLDPLDPTALSSVPHYRVVTMEGDGLWIPPWMWHRVDYYTEGGDDGGEVGAGASLAASLFHFRPAEFVWNNPLFAMLVVPNLIKEALGRNTE